MNLFIVALKNILRHKKRSALTITMVTVSVFLIIFGFSFQLGIIQSSYKNLKDFETGTFQLSSEQYFKERRSSLLQYTYNPEPIIQQLNNTPFQWTTRTYFKTEVIVYEDPYPQDASLYIQGVIIDPVHEKNVFKIQNYIEKGQFIDHKTTNGVLISRNLANKLGAEVGYEMVFTMKTKNRTEQLLDMKIIGIFNTPNPSVNRSQVLFSKNYMDETLELDGFSSIISFKTDELLEKRRFKTISDSLDLSGTDLKLYWWSEINKEVVDATKGKMFSMYFMAFFLFLISLIGISNTTLMSVNERLFEIGMLRSMGMSKYKILKLFSYEGLLIGLIGSVISIILILPINYYMVNTGITMNSVNENIDVGYRVMGHLKSTWSFNTMFLSFLFACIISIFSAFLSARRSTEIPIVQCLKEGV